jgi:hypothetical protein
MNMPHQGVISGKSIAPGFPPRPREALLLPARSPLHELNVPYEAMFEEYTTPAADVLFPPVRPTSLF